jgi:hypothetical protein
MFYPQIWIYQPRALNIGILASRSQGLANWIEPKSNGHVGFRRVVIKRCFTNWRTKFFDDRNFQWTCNFSLVIRRKSVTMFHEFIWPIATNQHSKKLLVESPVRCNVESLEQWLNLALSGLDLSKLRTNTVLVGIYNRRNQKWLVSTAVISSEWPETVTALAMVQKLTSFAYGSQHFSGNFLQFRCVSPKYETAHTCFDDELVRSADDNTATSIGVLDQLHP